MTVPIRYQVLDVLKWWKAYIGLKRRTHSVQEREGIVYMLGEFIEGLEPWADDKEVCEKVRRFLKENRAHLYKRRRSRKKPLVEGLRARNQ